MTATLSVEIWSDVVCPWCYIGKRRFEAAVAELRAGTDDEPPVELDITYRPYQLDPTADPDRSGPVFDAYVKKFGSADKATELLEHVTTTAAGEGLEFRMERAKRANTLRAHRLLWLAAQPDSPVSQDDLKERLMQAYFVDGLDVSDPSTLADLAAEVGFDRAEVVDFLAGNGGLDGVAEGLSRAGDLGITAVPTYVINGQWSIPGAQDTDTFVRALRKVASRQ